MYYGLRDISAHGFVFTNSDMKNYYCRISKTTFSSSSTRLFFESFENENLLKYMGVKFIEADSDNIGDGMPKSEETVFVSIPKEGGFEQEFTASNDDLSVVSFPVNIDGKKTGTLTIKMYGEGQEPVVSQTIKLSEIPHPTSCSSASRRLRIPKGKPIVWRFPRMLRRAGVFR